MAVLEGIVQSARMGQEGEAKVLRFVLLLDSGQRVPVEMTGQKINGFVSDGDRVQLDTDVRDKNGVVHPGKISDLTTASSVQAEDPDLPRKVLNKVPGLVASVIASVLTALAVKFFTDLIASTFGKTISPAGPEPSQSIITPSLIVGILAGLVVFGILYIRPRLLTRTQPPQG